MSANKKLNYDEILFMDDLTDDTVRPLNSEHKETVTRSENRSAPLRETDNLNPPRPTSGPEIDDLDSENANIPVSTNINGIDDGLLPEAPREPSFPRFPTGNTPPYPPPPSIVPTSPDVNIYQHKKTLAQGMMDLALLSANANQFRYVLQIGGKHPYYYPSLIMIVTSLFLQIVVGIGLIWNSRYNVKVYSQMCKANTANNWTVIGIFLVTVLNVFISSFGVMDLNEIN